MAFDIVRCGDPLHDYAGHSSSGDYLFSEPPDTDSLSELVSYAASKGLKIRTRGNGHSMNTLAVPRSGELVISTRNLCRYRFTASERVTVGAGAAVWDVQQMLAGRGMEMLVYNDGNAPASTLGGYLSSGGIGHTSHRNGGFWNTVEAVTLVTAAGHVRNIRRGEPEFPWLFGSMGQFGVVSEMELVTRPVKGNASGTPIGETGVVERTHYDWEPIVWFTLFVPRQVWRVARTQLMEIAARHTDAWLPRSPYIYPLPFRDFNPPLLHAYQGPLVGVGIWGDAPASGFDREAIARIEAEIEQLVSQNPLYRRYAQSEWVAPDFYCSHMTSAVWERFRFLKNKWDPQSIFVPGVFEETGHS
jgi:FAD/FMN-containing dehydrogenase